MIESAEKPCTRFCAMATLVGASATAQPCRSRPGASSEQCPRPTRQRTCRLRSCRFGFGSISHLPARYSSRRLSTWAAAARQPFFWGDCERYVGEPDYQGRHKTNGASRGAWGRCAEEACGAVAEPASWGMGARLAPSTRRCQGMLRATAVEEACAKRQEMMFGYRCECERRLATKV